MEDKLFQFIACGLTYDVTGVVLLGFAFFFKTKKAIMQEAVSCYSYNTFILEALIATKLDGIVGSTLLMVGFIFQLLGYIGFQNKYIVIISYLVLLILLIIYFVNLRKRIVKSWLEEIIENNKNDTT